MASSTAVSKTTFHSRSNSFPSKSHPLTTNVEDQLCKLRGFEATSTSASTISNNLSSLKDLHQFVDSLIHLPSFQRALSIKKSGSDEILEGSLRLLDFCSMAKEILLSSKESVQALQSSLRRKSSQTALTQDVMAYMVSRRRINKLVSKSIKNLMSFEKHCSLALLDEDTDVVAIANMLREVQAVSFSVLKSVLLYVSDTKAITKQSGWSLVKKLMQPKHVSVDRQQAKSTEVEKIDEALHVLINHKTGAEINTVAVVLKQLQTLECSIQELEEGLEQIFRCLLNTRVSLLNVLNH